MTVFRTWAEYGTTKSYTLGSFLGDLGPACRFGDVETNHAVIGFGQLGGGIVTAELASKPGGLIVKDVRKGASERRAGSCAKNWRFHLTEYPSGSDLVFSHA